MSPGGLQRACCCSPATGAMFETMLIAFKPTTFAPMFVRVVDGAIVSEELTATMWHEDASPHCTPIVRSPVDGFPTFLYRASDGSWEDYVYSASYGIGGWSYGLVLGTPTKWWYQTAPGIGITSSSQIYFTAECINTATKSGVYQSISSPVLLYPTISATDISISPSDVLWFVYLNRVQSSGVSEGLSGAYSCSHLPSGNLLVGCVGKVCERTGAGSYVEHALPSGYTSSYVIVRCDRDGGKHIILQTNDLVYGYAPPDSWEWQMDAVSLHDLGNNGKNHYLNINSADQPEVATVLLSSVYPYLGRVSIAEKVGTEWQSVTASQDTEAYTSDWAIGGAATLPMSW